MFTVFYIAKQRQILIKFFFIIYILARHEKSIVIDSPTLKISDYDFDNESHLDNRAAIFPAITLGPRLSMRKTMAKVGRGGKWWWRGWGGEVVWQKS